MKAKLVVALASALWLGAIVPSYADSFSTTGVSLSGLGATAGYSEFDKIVLSPVGEAQLSAREHMSLILYFSLSA